MSNLLTHPVVFSVLLRVFSTWQVILTGAGVEAGSFSAGLVYISYDWQIVWLRVASWVKCTLVMFKCLGGEYSLQFLRWSDLS